MLDIRLIRAEPERVKAELAKVGFPAAEVDALLDADRRRREALHALETQRAERTSASKAIRNLKDAAERERVIAAQRTLGERIAAAAAAAAAAEADFERRMLEVPNLPHPDVPVGPDESANVIVRTVGEPRRFDFPPLAHWDLGPQLGLIDFERGVKISGSRFYVLRGAGARLQRALITWMLDLHTREHGYVEVYPPAMVKRECLVGTGNLPKFGDNLYRDAEEDLWFVPTAEVPVTNLYRDEVLEVSSCSNFRAFQARRASIRYRPAPGARPELVHTLNGSGLALPRVLIAVLETYQRADGSVSVPEVLRPYVGADVIATQDPT